MLTFSCYWELRDNRVVFVFYSAVLFGCATLIKQHGAFFGIFGFIALLIMCWQNETIRKKVCLKYVLVFVCGIMIPLLLCFSYLLHAGVLKNFYLWTFAYAREYSSLVPTADIWYYFSSSFLPIWQHSKLIWIIAGIGLVVILMPTRFFPIRNRQSCIVLLGLTIGGIIALSIGFFFRPHYFVLILPAFAILFGIGIRYVFYIFSTASSSILRYSIPVVIVVITFTGTIVAHWDVLYQFSPDMVTRVTYGSCPFQYSQLIARLIQERTSKEDKIAISRK